MSYDAVGSVRLASCFNVFIGDYCEFWTFTSTCKKDVTFHDKTSACNVRSNVSLCLLYIFIMGDPGTFWLIETSNLQEQ